YLGAGVRALRAQAGAGCAGERLTDNCFEANKEASQRLHLFHYFAGSPLPGKIPVPSLMVTS
ncbi:MAG: hypothetical protein WBF30_19755, partial [Candidatus Acidiferrales bacterium]